MNTVNTQCTTRSKHHAAKYPIPAYRAALSLVAANALRTASIIAVDEVFADLHVLGEPGRTFDDGFLGMFYPQPRLPRYSPAIARKLYLGVVLVGWQLAQHEPLQHACVAEERAGHALIESARVHLELEGRKAEADANFSGFEEEFFEDLDFEVLFDPADDGVMHAANAEELGLVNLEFADWCRPFGRRAIHPYLWPDLPGGRSSLPRLIAPRRTHDLLPGETAAQLRAAIRTLHETEMTMGSSLPLQRHLAPRARVALHIAAQQVLDQCFDDLIAAERRLQNGVDDGLAESLTAALLPRNFREVLLATHSYLRAKAYFCTLVAVCWKVAQRERLPLTSRAEQAAARVLCEAAGRIMELAREPHEDAQAHDWELLAEALFSAWQSPDEQSTFQSAGTAQRRPEPSDSTGSRAHSQEPAHGASWRAWFESEMASASVSASGPAASASHPYILGQ